jgi:hypothetical protein
VGARAGIGAEAAGAVVAGGVGSGGNSSRCSPKGVTFRGAVEQPASSTTARTVFLVANTPVLCETNLFTQAVYSATLFEIFVEAIVGFRSIRTKTTAKTSGAGGT